MGARILIAEDEPFIIESLQFLLEREGHQVSAVLDGTAAIAALDGSKPDLVILDIMLPQQNGFEVLKWVRSRPALGGLKVLILTAKGQEADRRKAHEFGVDAFIAKPFSNRELVDCVNGLLAQRRPQETLQR